jgi:predicted MFS family arabinose efflux permease
VARDLQTDLAAVANLVAIMSVTWGITSLAAGAASDRFGRRPVLLAGLVALGASLIGAALAQTYPAAAVWRFVGGAGGGVFMGAVFAAASDGVPPERRGRALGWIVAGQSLSFVVGVPLVTFLGAFGGWRGALLVLGASALAAAVLVGLTVPAAVRTAGRRSAGGARIGPVLNGRLLALLLAGATERVCFAGLATYLATYLLVSYGVSLQTLAVGLALVALGNLLGNFVGSQLTDRVAASLLLFAGASLAAGALALPLLLWQPGLVGSLGLGFAYACANALGRPAILAALSRVPAEVRGTVMGLTITAASFGWLGATAAGGWLIEAWGFGSLGFLSAGAAFLGAAVAFGVWRAGAGTRAGSAPGRLRWTVGGGRNGPGRPAAQ